MPQELRIAIASAPDGATERRRALAAIARADRRYGGRVTLTPVPAPDDDADATLILAWNEVDDAFARILEHVAKRGGGVLFVRTDAVPLDLGDRDDVLRRLKARERLDDHLVRLGDMIRTVRYAGDVTLPVERELARLVDARTAGGAEPVDLRPRLDGTYIDRPRPLRLLPDTPGHVVVLEAPFGSGKSVLAAQWAETLEAEGVRVLWAPPAQHDGAVAPRLAGALGVAPDTPLPWLRERLWEIPTAVLVEDLPPGADLRPLLDDPEGFVLLAGREPLVDDGLQALARAGRLTRLGATDLAFDAEEAERLVGDPDEAHRLLGLTVGWALPLHVAALTGSTPEPAALAEGIRASLPEPAWRELLFLSAVPHLPVAATRAETDVLVANGFVQALGNAYRLHPWFAQVLLERHPDEVARTVAEEAVRLPLLLRGEAFARVNDPERLARVLEASVEAEAWREAPTRLVAWDESVQGFASPRRDWAVGAAHQRLGSFPQAIARLRAALDTPDFGPGERLGVARELCVPLGVTDPDEGRAMLERAERWIPAADPVVAARFLGNAAILHAHAGDSEAAVRTARRALAIFPQDDPHRVGTEVNLALFAWNLTGDFDARLETQRETLDRVAATYPVQALGQARDLGMFHAWLGDWDAARGFLERAAAGASVNPAVATEARAALAYLNGDAAGVAEQLRVARLFPDPYVADIVSMYEILLDLDAGDTAHAERTFEVGARGTFSVSAHARVLGATGRTEEALALLDSVETEDRARRLYLGATRYLLTRDREDLDAFLSVTTAGPRLLPGFLPLDALPDEPELTAHHPIEEVLREGGPRSVAARVTEAPPLRLDLLGTFEIRVLGASVDLATRHRQILVLLLMGLSRDEVGEAVWPETDVKKQRNNLNVQLAALRKALEPWGAPTYLTARGLQRVDSDYQTLLTALDAGDAAAVHDFYREPFAPGVDVEVVDDGRRRLRERVVQALYGAAVNGSGTERFLLRVLELEPLHEEALQALLRDLVRRGRRREARERYRRFEARLRDELQLEPLPDTRALLRP